MAAPVTCPEGPYYGFTEEQLLDERARYVAARQKAGSGVASFSVNGNSTTFSSVRRDWSLDEWQYAIAASLYLVNPTAFPAPSGGIASAAR